MSEIEELFKNADYCKKEICAARKIFGDKNTTEKQYDAMEHGLGLMFLYCPEDMKWLVLATLKEAEQRRYYFETIWWEKLAVSQ